MAFDFWYNSDVEFTGRQNAAHLVSSDGDGVARVWVFNTGQGIASEGARMQISRGAITFYVPDNGLPYRLEFYTNGASAVTLESGTLSQMVITRISSGSNIVKITETLHDSTPVTAGSPTAHGNALDELYTVSKQ